MRLANISQAALDAQVQPVLVDVVLGSGPVGATDFVAYEPGVADGSRVIAHEVVEVSALGSGHFVCSVPLRNAGAGLAVITEEPRLDHPSRDVDYIGRLTTQIVPRGEQTRAYFGPGVPLETPEDATLIVKVPYTDASGSTDASSVEGRVDRRQDREAGQRLEGDPSGHSTRRGSRALRHLGRRRLTPRPGPHRGHTSTASEASPEQGAPHG